MTKNTTKPVPLTKIETDIKGLDEILEGGFPQGRPTIVNGPHGCGKSIMGLEFLYRGALKGEPGIYINFEEHPDNIRTNALTLGWDLAALEKKGMLLIPDARLDPRTVVSGGFNFEALYATIEGAAKQMGAKRVVLDAVDVMLHFFDDSNRERQELYYMYDWITEQKMTALLTVKRSNMVSDQGRYTFLNFMVDCVINLDQRVNRQIASRFLRVSKYRGSGFGRNEYPYTITGKGMSVIPLSTTGLKHEPLGDYISSGHPRLDIMLGGGYKQGACILIAGVTGAGKTVVAGTFVRQACADGGRVLYIGFEESQRATVNNMLSPGIDLRPAIKNDQLRYVDIMPEAMGSEDHLINALDIIETWHPNHLIVDAISACERMGSQQIAYEYLMRLLNICKETGITSLFLNQITGAKLSHEFTGNSLSSFIDCILLLNLLEIGGELNRTAIVYKSRGTAHSNQLREFLITDAGVDFLDIFVGEGGVLTGAARQEQEAAEEAGALIRKQQIAQKEALLKKQQERVNAEAAAAEADISASQAELDALKLESRVIEEGREARFEMRGGKDTDLTSVDSYRVRMEQIATELTQFIENANAPVFGIDLDGNVTEWNKTAAGLTGYTKDEVQGRNLVADFITGDYKTSVKNVLDKALNGKETANFEFPLYAKNGKRLMILLNASTRRDITGTIVGVMGVGQDITEIDVYRENQERTVREWVQFIDSANAPVFGVDVDCNITEWNKKTESLTGYAKAEVLGKNLVNTYISEDYKEAVKTVLDKALRGAETSNYELPLYTKTKRLLMILLNATTRRDADGKIVGVIGVGQDITEIDEYRENQERTVREWVQFIDSANAPVFGVDVDCNITEWNKKTESLTGYAKAEVSGKNLVNIYITEDYRTAVKAVLDKALQGVETSNYELPLYTKNKRRLMILLNATTRRDADGTIVGVIGVGQDITGLNMETEDK
ncbi:circadian clock protein KaiC [Desulfococcaceae bacterium HSG7]|nr:circadian clock protein KaiC [Desulfococcaceae bacterium HSG7]